MRSLLFWELFRTGSSFPGCVLHVMVSPSSHGFGPLVLGLLVPLFAVVAGAWVACLVRCCASGPGYRLYLSFFSQIRTPITDRLGRIKNWGRTKP